MNIPLESEVQTSRNTHYIKIMYERNVLTYDGIISYGIRLDNYSDENWENCIAKELI